jgi:acetyl esterase/lipase
MTRRWLIASLAALGLTPGAALGATTHAYADPRRKGVAPLADVYVPADPRGAVVLVHGGGFVVGSRQMPAMQTCAAALNRVGLAAIVVDYRLLLRGGRFDEALGDVLASIAWWRSAAAGLGVSSERLGLMGLSAGGALAAIAASEAGAHAWVGVYGPYDFRALPGQPAFDGPTRWLLDSTDPAVLLGRSPLARATAPIPTLLFHGTRDQLVPIAHSQALVAARQAARLPVELRTVDAGHGYLQHESEHTTRTLDESAAFFARHLIG